MVYTRRASKTNEIIDNLRTPPYKKQTAQTFQTTGIDVIGCVLVGLTAGFSIDYAVSKAKKSVQYVD